MLSFTLIFLLCLSIFVFFFFKQKTAYEMRISDWSSDVCSSDLMSLRTWQCRKDAPDRRLTTQQSGRAWAFAGILARATAVFGSQEKAEEWLARPATGQIGRASCRERVCQYV